MCAGIIDMALSRFFHAIPADGWLCSERMLIAHTHCRLSDRDAILWPIAIICVVPYVRDGFGQRDGGGSVRESIVKSTDDFDQISRCTSVQHGRVCIDRFVILF